MTERFRYRAARADGRIVGGVVQAVNGPAAMTLLVGRGLHPLAVEPAPAVAPGRGAARRDLAVVFQSLASLVAAGVPLERAVAATEPLARGELRVALEQARAQLREGRTLSQALDAGGGVVPPIIVGMLRAGERASQLGRALAQVAEHLAREAELVSRVRTALAYPAVLAVVGAASVTVIATTVVPKFAGIVEDLGAELPTSTRLLLTLLTFGAEHTLFLFTGGIAVVAGAASWYRRPAGRLAVARTLLRLPVLGSLRQALATARWGLALGGMLETGMPLLTALEAARDTAGDPAIGERLLRVRDAVAQGQALTPSLERERALLPSALQLVAVGEASGQLATMVARAGALAAAEADRRLKAVVGLLEPALVVVFGGLVAFVAAALLQAVYSLRPGGM